MDDEGVSFPEVTESWTQIDSEYCEHVDRNTGKTRILSTNQRLWKSKTAFDNLISDCITLAQVLEESEEEKDKEIARLLRDHVNRAIIYEEGNGGLA